MTLTARAITLSYGSDEVLRSVDVQLAPAEVVALTGPSGSGKSSLLYCLAGLVRPSSGSVRFDGRELTELSADEAAAVRRASFGFVFQQAELVPELTLAENVGLPLELVGSSRVDRRRRVAELLERLGIGEASRRRPDQVSGGQAQRAAVARALAHRPAVVFADEPTGALDSENGREVLRALIELAVDEGSAVLLVTHDHHVAAAAHRRVALSDGRVVATIDGTT